jgi:hypothetical protein
MATSIAYAGGTIMHFNLKNIISQLSLQQFKSDERGAVTVDWVVLTAAIIGLATAAWMATRDGTLSAANTVQNGVANASIGPKDNN